MINFAIDEVIDPKLRNQTLAVRKRWLASRDQKTQQKALEEAR